MKSNKAENMDNFTQIYFRNLIVKFLSDYLLFGRNCRRKKMLVLKLNLINIYLDKSVVFRYL